MDEQYHTPESRIPRWVWIAGVVVVFLCLAVLVALFLARMKLFSFAVGILASDTPLPSETALPTETFTPRPTDTATPTSPPADTATPTVVPMPPVSIMSLAQGGPALDELFTDNTNSWQGANQISEVVIQEGQLQLRSSDPGSPAIGYCQGDKCGPYKDFYYYQAEIVEDRPTTLGLGLVFAMNQSKSGFYAFQVRPSAAEFSLWKVTNGQFNKLIDWTSNPAIKLYPFINKLGVSYQEGHIQLFANGEQVATYTDQQPYKEGRVGFSVESDGLRLLADSAMVMTLSSATPVPQPQSGLSTQPPSYQSPTPGLRYSPTPTQPGSCPAYVPKGYFVLVVLKASPGKSRISINGSNQQIVQGNNVFYLPLSTTQIVEVGNKTHEYKLETCKIINIKLK